MLKKIEDIAVSILEFLQKKTSISTIYFYGSILTDRFNDESDIDIAIISKDCINYTNLLNWALELGMLLKRDVHLVDFVSSPPILKIEILRSGKIMYCNDNEYRLKYESIAISEYCKLNEEIENLIKSKYGETLWKSF